MSNFIAAVIDHLDDTDYVKEKFYEIVYSYDTYDWILLCLKDKPSDPIVRSDPVDFWFLPM